MTDAPHPTPSPLAKLLLDLGPVVTFFVAYLVLKRTLGDAKEATIAATGIFMAATAAAMLVSRLRTGAISPMLWFSGVMVLGFGGLTLWLRDDWFIKVKPTIYYLMLAGFLGFGLWTRRPTLQYAFGAAYPGLTERGWTLLTRNWACFFVAMAIANELVWRHASTEFWIGYKLWGALPATILFALANVPMLMRHGLDAEAATETLPGPPEG